MIAIDTSAIMAILLNEPEADACIDALETNERIVISAGTLAEMLIVAGRRSVASEALELIRGLGVEIAPVTPASSMRMALAYRQWGKGMHPASLNFGDCFAYDIASERACPLLFIGNDFSQTDIQSVL